MPTTISGDTGVIFPDATTQSTAVNVTTPFSVNALPATGAELRLPEATVNGVHYVSVKAPDLLAGSVTFTLPTADGTSGQLLQTNGGGQLSFTNPPSYTSPFSIVGNATAGAEIRLPEDTDNGANYVALKAPNSLGSNLTLTLPSADGTSGQMIQTDGAGTLSFGNPGSMVLLQTVTGSSVDTIDITGNFTSTYRIYKLYITASFSLSVQVNFRFFINGSIVTSASYGYGGAYAASATPAFVANSGATTSVAGSLSAKVNTFEMTFFNPSDSTNRAPVFVVATGATDSASSYFNGQFFNGTAGTAGTRAITGVRAFSGGDLGTWTAKLYGIKE